MIIIFQSFRQTVEKFLGEIFSRCEICVSIESIKKGFGRKVIDIQYTFGFFPWECSCTKVSIGTKY